MLAKEIFESKALRKKAFYADDRCLIFCGEVREVLKWLRDANVRVDCMVTSPPFYGQRDYGVAGQLGLLSPCRTKIDCISTLEERDSLGGVYRALPPAEHYVVVAWYNSPEQLEWTLKNKIANVRLGDRPGAWHVPPEMAAVQHVLLRSHAGQVASGLFHLRSRGYEVFTADELKDSGYPGRAKGEIYAVFQVEEDPKYEGREWNGSILMDVIEAFEAPYDALQRLKRGFHFTGVPLKREEIYDRCAKPRQRDLP